MQLLFSIGQTFWAFKLSINPWKLRIFQISLDHLCLCNVLWVISGAFYGIWTFRTASLILVYFQPTFFAINKQKICTLTLQWLWGLNSSSCPNGWLLWRERKNQQDATIRCLLSTSFSTCFGHHYAHLQENKDRVLLHRVYCAGSAGCGW